ncbi:MAG TPA: ABC-2 family transporter protein, partial [Bacillota bacterium]|nr:ABC-2 family transporter protein [Bacillota bacterium]
SRTVVSAWGDLAYGIILYLAAFGFQPGPFGLFCLFAVCSGLLMGSVIFSAETLTFFVGNASAIGRMFLNFLISFTLYPEGIYRGAVRWIIYSLIPAGFIAFLPLRIMKGFSWPWLGLLIAIDLAYLAGSYFLFKLGIKRYESGNLIVSKL